MQITGLHIEAFKSLYNTDCRFGTFNVITGPNGSGKSNLVEAANFVGEVYEDGLEFAVGRRGGYDNIAHRRTRRARRPVTISLDVLFGPEDFDRINMWGFVDQKRKDASRFYLRYRHTFSIGTSSRSRGSDFEVRFERIQLLGRHDELLVLIERTEDGEMTISPNEEAIQKDSFLEDFLDPLTDARRLESLQARRNVAPTMLLFEAYYISPIFLAIRQVLGGIRVFQLSPSICRISGVPTPNAALERFGGNLPAAANHLSRNSPKIWEKVREGMRSIVPDLVNIELVYTEDRRLAVVFRERGVGRPWSTGEVSDGTIQSLALLLALHDPRSPLLLIEEPENSVHPWIIRQFVDLCRESGKQIFLTTHSPVVLDYVPPECVSLIAARRGRSRMYNLMDIAPEVRPLVKDGELSLFEVYDSGLIRSAVPRGYVIDDEFESEEDE